MAEDKELVLPAGLEGMGVDPPDKLRLRLPAPLPSDIMPLSKTFHLTIIQVYIHIIYHMPRQRNSSTLCIRYPSCLFLIFKIADLDVDELLPSCDIPVILVIPGYDWVTELLLTNYNNKNHNSHTNLHLNKQTNNNKYQNFADLACDGLTTCQ